MLQQGGGRSSSIPAYRLAPAAARSLLAALVPSAATDAPRCTRAALVAALLGPERVPESRLFAALAALLVDGALGGVGAAAAAAGGDAADGGGAAMAVEEGGEEAEAARARPPPPPPDYAAHVLPLKWGKPWKASC